MNRRVTSVGIPIYNTWWRSSRNSPQVISSNLHQNLHLNFVTYTDFFLHLGKEWYTLPKNFMGLELRHYTWSCTVQFCVFLSNSASTFLNTRSTIQWWERPYNRQERQKRRFFWFGVFFVFKKTLWKVMFSKTNSGVLTLFLSTWMGFCHGEDNKKNVVLEYELNNGH